MHALLNIADREAPFGHPVVGASWEGFVIENLIGAAPQRTATLFYRSLAGAEIDLLLEVSRHGLWAVEVRRGPSVRPEKGFFLACADSSVTRRFVVHSGKERYKIAQGAEAISLRELVEMLASLQHP